MATKKLSLFMTLLTFASLFGCNNDTKSEDPYTMKSPYFVQTYLDANDFELKECYGSENYIVGIFFKGERISILPPVEDKERFEKLANAFGDGSYTGTLIPDANKALSDAITEVSVVCNKDYDTEHCAGNSLNDIVLFCATSPFDFIRGGYKSEAEGDTYPDYWNGMAAMNQGQGYKPVEMLVSEVNNSNTSMLYPICNLYFKKRPTQIGEYRFTVTVKIGNSEMTSEIVHSF